MTILLNAAALLASTLGTMPTEFESKLPAGTREMIEAAIADGDAKAIDTVLRLARQTSPEAVREIDAIEKPYRDRIEEARRTAERERLAEITSATMFEHWKGQVEVGGSRSTGSSNNLGLYGALSAEREGLQWVHKLAARVDIQKSNDVTTTERVLASWQPNYKVGDRFYAYGLAQYEYDPILGYDSRYTAGAGIGYGLVRTPKLRVDFEGGPAYRRTDMVDGPDSATVAGRGSINVGWKISSTVELKQVSSVYYEEGESSASALTSLDTKLFGDLKARFSYNVQYEEGRPRGTDPVDTLSRATLVYSF